MRGVQRGAGLRRRVAVPVPRRFEALPVRPGPDVGIVDRRGERIEHRVVGSQVEDVGAGVLLGSAYSRGMGVHQPTDPAVWIVEIPYPYRVGGADDDTGRFEILVD